MIKTITFMSTLMQYAIQLGDARLSGDPDRIAKAEKAHDDYQRACLESDEMICQLPPMRNS